MGRKTNDPKVKEAVRVMMNAGQSQRAIAASLKMRRSSVAEIMRQIREEAPMQRSPDDEPGTPANRISTNSGETDPSGPTRSGRRSVGEAIEARTVSRFAQKGGEYLSDELLKEMKISMEEAKVLRNLELRYRTSVERYGVDWIKFLNEAVEWAYESIVETYKIVQELREEQRERAILDRQFYGTLDWVLAAQKAEHLNDVG
ncbi:hypothetical protein ApAK_07600 [Thermoplasmatales archaeon AK]|nr:hypothetical protein [Thermoplasmatales archaeon AK]